MARIRTVKPELFKHEELFDAEIETGLPLRLAYIGLFTCADREGRFKWKPRTLKSYVLPFDDEVDFSRVLDALATRGFIKKYSVQGVEYGWIEAFSRHQIVNNKEKESEIPAFEDSLSEVDEKVSNRFCNQVQQTVSTRQSRVSNALPNSLESPSVERKGKEGKGKEGKERVGAPASRGLRLPPDWKLCDADRDFCHSERPDLNPDKVAEAFFDYWTGKPGKDGVKTDWSATWRNWVRKEKASPVNQNVDCQPDYSDVIAAAYGTYGEVIEHE